MTIAAEQLRSIVERIERLESEIRDLNGDKSEVYKEAKANGWDVAAIRKIVAERRDENKASELREMVDLYRDALTRAAHVHARAA